MRITNQNESLTGMPVANGSIKDGTGSRLHAFAHRDLIGTSPLNYNEFSDDTAAAISPHHILP
jgi:hypothetical protein